MEYEVKYVPSFTFCGFRARAANTPEGFAKITKLWSEIMQSGKLNSITNLAREEIIAIYSNYESNESIHTQPYDITVTKKVNDTTGVQPEGSLFVTVPAQRYAEFTTPGDNGDATYELWKKIWAIDLHRAHTYDLEIHRPTGGVTILIALKDE